MCLNKELVRLQKEMVSCGEDRARRKLELQSERKKELAKGYAKIFAKYKFNL